MNNIEQELKVLLEQREYNILQQHTTSSKVQTNHYFYGEGMPDGMMVRIRQDSGYFLTVKVHISYEDNINVCREYVQEIDSKLFAQMIVGGITSAQLCDIVKVDIDTNLRYIGNMVTHRSILPLLGHNIELDANTYLGRTDYELEYESSDYASICQLRHMLQYQYALLLTPSQPKYIRYRNALSGIPMPIGTL